MKVRAVYQCHPPLFICHHMSTPKSPRNSRSGRRSSHRSARPLPIANLRRPSGGPSSSNPGSGTVSAAGSVSSRPSLIDMENPHPDVVRDIGRYLPASEDEDAVGEGEASLRMPGGDMTRQIVNWQRTHEGDEADIKRGRSRSFDVARRPTFTRPTGEPLEARQILVPGGMRREYVLNQHEASTSAVDEPAAPEGFYTHNFIEFLSLYGHFAGEELEEIDEEDETSERTPLRPQHGSKPGRTSTLETVMLLLKSFVGTGVLFLPKAFSNGGLLFCSGVLIVVSIISYWCFLLLISTKNYTKVSSFGDIGGALYGPKVRQLILSSIVVSQIGFASAYVVFVSENLQSFITNVKNGELWTISSLIILQLIVFLPLSMVRDIGKLGFTALIADAFILTGLCYLYGWSGLHLITKGVEDVVLFNSKDWTLFIGTAVFAYEGICLIIPIQESMRHPQKFDSLLGAVMIIITVIMVSVGVMLYSATGSNVQTVILLNLPHSPAVALIQLLYSIAILLSTPLQLFPAIRILEQALFSRSGKFNKKVKWEKNLFRFCVVFFTGVVAYVGADDLDKFVALVGSFACVPLVYIYPPWLHMACVQRLSIAWLLDVFLMVFGIIMMSYTSYMTLMSWVG